LVLLCEAEDPVRKDDHDASLATAAVLVDDVRRRIFGAVRRARRPLTRDEAAASARVSRALAAFHLDKLVEAGLLRAHSRPSGAGRVGRRPKVYEAGPAEVHLDVPGRQHALLAGMLVEALADGAAGADARRAAAEAARRRGAELGRSGSPAPAPGLAEVAAALERLGFEPFEAAPGTLRMGNCPFQPVAARAPEVVCGLNLALVEGLLAGMEARGLHAVLAPRAGGCCVEVGPEPAGVRSDADQTAAQSDGGPCDAPSG
jgi:predicted ArsR family transcriptional regulator